MKLNLFLFLAISFTTLLYGQIEESGAYYCSQKKTVNGSKEIRGLNIVSPHYDVLNYSLDLDLYNNFLTPFPKTFKGSITMTVLIDSAINTMLINAEDNYLGIDSVSLAGVSLTHVENILTVILNRTYEAGETLSVKIYYNHKNISGNSFFTYNGVVNTFSEPEGARRWFPCLDKPLDKSTFELRVKTPANVKLGANGSLIDSVKIQDTIYYRWVSRDPIATYLVVLTGAVDYGLKIFYWHKISNPDDSIPVRFYYDPTDDPGNADTSVSEMMDCFSQLFGDFPFEKNGFASLYPDNYGGGMENQTLITLSRGDWHSWETVSHELAHQWFGDMITCATWADIGLNEGFATYCEALWIQHKNSNVMYNKRIKYFADWYLGQNPGWPIYNPEWAIRTPANDTLFSPSITYMKGACALHMLRYVLGDSLFFKGMKDYANSQFKYKSAMLSDFFNIMNQSSGQDLNWFFNQWYLQPNHPIYANTYYYKDKGDGNWDVSFTAKQIQTNAGFFKMPVEVKIKFYTGNDTTIQVMNDANNQSFIWTFNRQPKTFLFDPDNEIVLKKATLTYMDPTPVKEEGEKVPGRFSLYQNYPNPFNPNTIIKFELPEASKIKLSVYNILGEEIKVLREGNFDAGTYEVVFSASNLPSGIYIYKLQSKGKELSAKMILAK